jgi:hypothetical protein
MALVLLASLWWFGASFALAYFAVALYVVSLMFIPGYALASYIFKDSSGELKVAASTAVITPVYSLVILVAIATGVYRDWLSSIFAAIALAGGALILLRKKGASIKEFQKTDKTHLKWTLLLFFFSISLMALPALLNDIPGAIGHSLQETRIGILPGDMYLPYRLEQILLNGANWKGVNFYGMWQVTDRTPMMGLVASFVSSSLHVLPPLDWVWNVPDAMFSWNVFQIVGIFLDAQILLSAFLLLQVVFGKKKAQLAMPFLAVSPFVIWNTFYTSPKSMAAYFVLIAFVLILERKSIRAGVFAALGFLSHSYVLFYVLGCIYLALRSSSRRILERLRAAILFLIPAGLVVAPWLLWSTLIYGHASSFIVYPLASSAAASATQGLHEMVSQFLKAPWDLFIWVRVVNLFRTLTPWTLAFVPAWFTSAGWVDTFPYTTIGALLMIMYLFTLPGGISLSLTLPAYQAWLTQRTNIMHGIATIPIVAAVLFFGYTNWGLALLMAQPLVPFMIGAAVSLLSKRWAIILFLTSLTENVYVIWMHIYPATLFLVRIHTLSDFVFVGAILVWVVATTKMTLNTFRENLD